MIKSSVTVTWQSEDSEAEKRDKEVLNALDTICIPLDWSEVIHELKEV